MSGLGRRLGHAGRTSLAGIFAIAAGLGATGCPTLLGVDGEYSLESGDSGSSVGPEVGAGDDAAESGAVHDGATPDASEDAPSEGAPSDSGPGDAADSGDAAPPSDAGPSDAGPSDTGPPDAPMDAGGADAAPTDAGLVSDPGFIACGGTACDRQNYQGCCYAPAGPLCQPSVNGCTGPTYVNCDEDADCPGQVCCIDSLGAGFRSLCASSCTAGAAIHVCKTSAACGTQACVPWTCKGVLIGTCDGKGSDAAAGVCQ